MSIRFFNFINKKVRETNYESEAMDVHSPKPHHLKNILFSK